MASMPLPVLLRDIYEECDCPTKNCRCGAMALPRAGDEVHPHDLSEFPRVFALDPGTHSGWACIWFDPDVLFDQNSKASKAPIAWQAGQFIGDEIQQVKFLLGLVRNEFGGDGMAIVIENFVVRSVKMEDTFLSPVRIGHMLAFGLHIGGGEADGEFRSRKVAEWPSANDAKHVCTDSRLKIWQTYLPGPDHPRDATRHAHLWLRRLKSGGEALYEHCHYVDEV